MMTANAPYWNKISLKGRNNIIIRHLSCKVENNFNNFIVETRLKNVKLFLSSPLQYNRDCIKSNISGSEGLFWYCPPTEHKDHGTELEISNAEYWNLI